MLIDYERFNYCRKCGLVVGPKSVLRCPNCSGPLKVVPAHGPRKRLAWEAYERSLWRGGEEARAVFAIDRAKIRRWGK